MLRKYFLIILSVVFALTLASCNENPTKKAIKDIAKEYNEQCPIKMSESMALTECKTVDDTIVFNYATTEKFINGFDEEKQRSEVFGNLSANNGSQKLMLMLKKSNMTLQYVYTDGTRNKKISIIPSELPNK